MFNHERQGGSGNLHADSNTFHSFIDKYGLIDLGYTGSDFTWDNGREMKHRIFKRLDRFLVNNEANLMWANASVRHLARFSSDHAPILLRLNPVTNLKTKRRPFRMEVAWFSHEDFIPLVQAAWSSNTQVSMSLLKLKSI